MACARDRRTPDDRGTRRVRVLLKDAVVVLIPETDDEAEEIALWKATHADHVLRVEVDDAPGRTALGLHDLGPRPEACREPINVVSSSRDPIAKTISNLAPTPFELDGRYYQSVESFWQGLKFPEAADRARLGATGGAQALHEGSRKGYGKTVVYEGAEIAVGTFEHWQLMERACRAKFDQNADAREALLATGSRPLVHIVRRDSRSIPGVIMAQIWMRIRERLRKVESSSR